MIDTNSKILKSFNKKHPLYPQSYKLSLLIGINLSSNIIDNFY